MRCPVVLACLLVTGVDRSCKQGCGLGALWLLGLALGPAMDCMAQKRLFGSRSGWLLAVATKHTKQERPSPVSERRSCCLAKSRICIQNAEWGFRLAVSRLPVRQLLTLAQSDRRLALDAPESIMHSVCGQTTGLTSVESCQQHAQRREGVICHSPTSGSGWTHSAAEASSVCSVIKR